MIDEMICTDTLGVALKTGNLNSPCNTLCEVDGPNCTDAQYVYALSGAGFGTKYTGVMRVIWPGAEAILSLPYALVGP